MTLDNGRSLGIQTGAKMAVDPIYTCPMHPEVEQDHPGACPKYGRNGTGAKESDSGHGWQ